MDNDLQSFITTLINQRKTPINDFLPLWGTLKPLAKENGCSLHICDYTVEYEGNSYILYETIGGEPLGIDIIY